MFLCVCTTDVGREVASCSPASGSLCQGYDDGDPDPDQHLDGERREDDIQPFGGGYFFALPGVRNHDDWLGGTLLG
jgi:hypothetical protein